MKRCHACGAGVGSPESAGRRDVCLRCGADLRCCLNCRFYSAAHHNDCIETQSELVADKTRSNFCDFFGFRLDAGAGVASGAAARAQLDVLFEKKE